MKYYPLNEETAREAWEMNHFGEFRSDESDYRAAVDGTYALAEEAAQYNPERREEVFSIADRYAKRLADWYDKKYRIDSRCPSVLISGPANFPVRKKDKQVRALDGHYEELRRIEGLRERIRSIGDAPDIIKCGDEDAIEKLNAKIGKLTERQEQMKAANAQARKEGKEAPYPSFTLSNNSQKIRAARKRLEELEAVKDEGTKRQTSEFMGESVEVVENTELMRLQLLFDGKPSDEVRAALKKNGFRWSPKQGAWQRQLTANARYAFRRMTKSAGM